MNSKMRKIYPLLILLVGVSFYGCNDDSVEPTPQEETPKASQESLLAQKWILSETFEDGVQKTSNGTGEYEFTKDGAFRFKSEQGVWSDIATYSWNDEDSVSLSVIFTGSINTLHWNIETLDDSNLKTMFYSGSKQFHYNYSR